MRGGYPCSTPRPRSDSRAAVQHSLLMIVHRVSGTAWGFIEPQSREVSGESGMRKHASVSYLGSVFIPGPLEAFSFFSVRPNLPCHYHSPERPAIHAKRAGGGWTDAEAKILAQVRSFTSGSQRGTITLMRNYFLLDQFIYAPRQGWLFKDCQPYNDSVAL